MRDKILQINRRRMGIDASDTAADMAFSKDSGADRRLCVYGRMRPGGPDAHVLAPFGGDWTRGDFPGFLQNGAVCSLDVCPGLAWAPDGPLNPGHILTSDQLPARWSDIDSSEGGNYVRLLTPVHTEAGDIVANVYVSADASRAQILMADGMNVHDDVDFRL